MQLNEIEGKWQKKWSEEKAYEFEKEEGKGLIISPAFPYPNSPQHIGHARTYTVADIHARYLRLIGKSVLFPMGFHVTGTPILAMAKKIAKKDPELMRIFTEIYGMERKVAEGLTDPEQLVMYFSDEIEKGMKEMGFSIDWRRKFYTFDKHFNKFIIWQFHKLKENGYIVKGEHPVAWCPECNNAVSSHDTKEDKDPEIEEITAIKYKYGDGFILTGTYRPETIYGVTNLWINPNIKYLKVKAGNEYYYISEGACPNLSLQMEMERVEEMDGREFIGKTVKEPFGREIPILEADFVKGEEGTGAVMSVPAHAPLDFLALRDLGKLEEIKPIKIIEGEGIPAEEVVKKLGVKDQNDPLAEKATKMLYKQEAHSGKMIVKGLEGEKVMDAKETTKKKLVELGFAFPVYVLANAPVECRCGAPVGVKKVKDQWFIDYGNKKWKEKSKEWIGKMRIIPEKTRKEYLNTVNWLDKKACTRAAGLGTEFPFDKGKIIDPLSDSTIYMAFYTIANKIKEFEPEELNLEFFDFVFLGKGKGDERMKELREKFLYWYPVYARHSGADLTRNHLPFFIMNHVAIFPKEQWPLGTVVNGFVLMEGKKMSKSLGNILPLRKAIKEYGADVIRFSVTGGADLALDTNFEKSVAEGVNSRIIFLLETAEKYGREKQGEEELLEWLLSGLYRRVKKAEELYGEMKLREIGHELFYETYSDLQWYLKRTEKPALNEFFMVWTTVFSPFIPHTCEEIWHIIGNENSILKEHYPKIDDSMIKEETERAEEIVKTLRKDIETVSEIVGKKPKKITIFLAAGWKYDAYNRLREHKKLDEVLKNVKEREKTAAFLKSYMKYAHSLPEIIESEKEREWIKKAKKFMKKEFGADVDVVEEEKSDNERAVKAKPGKPSILIE